MTVKTKLRTYIKGEYVLALLFGGLFIMLFVAQAMTR